VNYLREYLSRFQQKNHWTRGLKFTPFSSTGKAACIKGALFILPDEQRFLKTQSVIEVLEDNSQIAVIRNIFKENDFNQVRMQMEKRGELS
jgi:hypothetical protein